MTDELASTSSSSDRTRVRRLPERGRYERDTIDAILDECLVSHLGFVIDGQPYVIPTLHARIGDDLYIHGSAASRPLRRSKGSFPLCLTATITDAIVLARSAFRHSINYRSVVVLGEATVVLDPQEKLAALELFTNRLVPGRWDEVRPPNESEFKQTSIMRLPIAEASAKVREGPPGDEPDDLALPVWAGLLPVRVVTAELQPDSRLAPGTAVPDYLTKLKERIDGGRC